MSNSPEKEISDKRDFLEALNNYYRLKFNYESSLDKEKNSIIQNNNLSWKEKRSEFKNYKPKCINCKRPVGTLFTRTYDEKEYTIILKAMCGDLQNPCNLNITLNIGYIDTIQNIINADEKDKEKSKISIIKDKNNLLFGYITTEEALQNFDKLKKEIVDITSSLETIQSLWINISDNSEKEQLLKRNQEESYLIINNINTLIKQYDDTNNHNFINDAVNIYINQLIPKLKTIMNLKYNVNFVEFIEEENAYHLIQQKLSIQNLEFDYSKPSIVHYDIGITNKNNTKEKIIMNIGKPNETINNNSLSQNSQSSFLNEEVNLNDF
jgi:hypothetical protein